MTTKTIRILTGTSFTFPSDFGAPWSIECVGAGSTGNGTGAAYGKLTDTGGTVYNPGDVKSYAIGAAGATGGNSYFDGASFAAAAVGAQGGQFTSGGQASARPNSANTSGFNGGNSGTYFPGCCLPSSFNGGGAAGKNGAGQSGFSFLALSGAGDNGTGGTSSSGNGNPGTEWSFTDTWNGSALTGVSGNIGSGSGGGNSFGSGGLYGGGAVGGGPQGGPGFILITYTVTATGGPTPSTFSGLGPAWPDGFFGSDIISFLKGFFFPKWWTVNVS